MLLCRGLSCKKGGQSLTSCPWRNQAFQSLGFPCNTEGDLFLGVLRKTVAPSRHWYTPSTLHTPRPRGNFLAVWQSSASTTSRVAVGVVALEHSVTWLQPIALGPSFSRQWQSRGRGSVQDITQPSQEKIITTCACHSNKDTRAL